jgi:hemerythrin-like domain-containing protein
MEKTSPIKRSKNLVTLSREHHDSLLIVWKIRRGLNKQIDIKEITDYIVYCWKEHLQKHFQQEEQYLFKPYKQELLCAEVLKQHEELKDAVKRFENEQSTSEQAIRDFADKLEQHIRFEEREVFPYLERKIEPEELVKIGEALNKEHTKFPDEWENAFWIYKQ